MCGHFSFSLCLPHYTTLHYTTPHTARTEWFELSDCRSRSIHTTPHHHTNHISTSSHLIIWQALLKKKVKKQASFEAEEDDTAADGGVGGDDANTAFISKVRQKAQDFVDHDTDGNLSLDFEEFCALVREREPPPKGGIWTEELLQERFEIVDWDKNGTVELNEYIRYSLRDALSKSAAR